MKTRTANRLYLGEAIVMLTLARVAVRIVPTARILAWAKRPPREIRRFRTAEHAGWVRWAIDAATAKRWMRAKCLPRALAAQAMLRRRGIPTRLCLGIARDDQGLAAHAWLELSRDVVVGGDEAPRFTRLVEYGGERA